MTFKAAIRPSALLPIPTPPPSFSRPPVISHTHSAAQRRAFSIMDRYKLVRPMPNAGRRGTEEARQQEGGDGMDKPTAATAKGGGFAADAQRSTYKGPMILRGQVPTEAMFNTWDTISQPENPKGLTVALIGLPNAGKTSLLNAFLPHRIAAVSPKVNTTRREIRGIVTDEASSTQLVFIDAPGILPSHQRKFARELANTAWRGYEAADLALFVVDAVKRPTQDLFDLVRRLAPRRSILEEYTDWAMEEDRAERERIQQRRLYQQQFRHTYNNNQHHNQQQHEAMSDDPSASPSPSPSPPRKYMTLTADTTGEGEVSLTHYANTHEDGGEFDANTYSVPGFTQRGVELLPWAVERQPSSSPADHPSFPSSVLETQAAIQSQRQRDQFSLSLVGGDGAAPTSEVDYRSERERLIPVILVLNKVDKASQDRYVEWRANEFTSYASFEKIFYVSAKRGDGVDDLKAYLMSRARPRTWMCPPDMVTTQSKVQLVEEMIATYLYCWFNKQVPYRIEQKTVGWTPRLDGSLIIEQELLAEDNVVAMMICGIRNRIIFQMRKHVM